MYENLRIVVSLTRRDPFVLLGLHLMATHSIPFIHIQFKMREVGYKTYPLMARPYDHKLPGEYFKIRDKHGWSPWPAYLMGPCLLVGICLLGQVSTLRTKVALSAL